MLINDFGLFLKLLNSIYSTLKGSKQNNREFIEK